MTTEAWHIVTTTDPLVDSDEENPNQHVRHDYSAYMMSNGFFTDIHPDIS